MASNKLFLVWTVIAVLSALLDSHESKKFDVVKKSAIPKRSDFIFIDDEDSLMLKDEASGDGPDESAVDPSGEDSSIDEIKPILPPVKPDENLKTTVRPKPRNTTYWDSIPPNWRPQRPLPTLRPTTSAPTRKPPCSGSTRRCPTTVRPCGSSKRRCRPTNKLPCRNRCRPPPPVKIPSINKTVPPPFGPTRMCGKTFFCPKGSRGPCDRNEIFSPTSFHDSSSRAISLFNQPVCPSRPIGCFPTDKFSSKNVNTLSTGFCTVRFRRQPCFGYPSNFRFCQRTKRCYPATLTPPSLPSSKRSHRQSVYSPCSADQYFSPVDKTYGFCRCSRPDYVRCRNTQRCYPAYSKGSCSKGQWLVPSGSTGFSTCQLSPCPLLADGHHLYWSGRGHNYGRPGCYKSHTQGPCRPQMQFVIDDMIGGLSRCVSKRTTSNESYKHKKPSSAYGSLLQDWDLFFGNGRY